MPRNGSGVMSKPAGTTAVANTQIESVKYNSTIDDIIQDLNNARPITAGGTGATSAAAARTALGFPGDAANFSVKGADIASASTTDLSTATGDYVTVTGTTTITALGTAPQGTTRRVLFSGILTLTHNATSLILLGGANITTAAGDIATFVSEGSGNWRQVGYSAAITSPTQWTKISTTTVSGSPSIIDFTNLGRFRELRLTGWVTGSGATGGIQLRVSANNGSSYDSGASDYTQQVITATAASISAGTATSASMQVSASAGVTRMSINAILTGFNQATRSVAHVHCYGSDNAGIVVETVIGGERNNNTAHNAFRLLLAAGTFSGGELILEGLPG